MNRLLLDGYAAWPDGKSYAQVTEYLELTTLKQIVNFLVESQHLPGSVAFNSPLKKPDGTDTYCWRSNEVVAILEDCQTPELTWLWQVIIGLSATGLHISELASLRWCDINLENGLISLTDETTQKSRQGKERRTTKSGHGQTS